MTHEEAVQIFTDCKRAYQLAFGSPAGAAVLTDLTPFCRVKETCVVPGDRDRSLVLEGRREVYLRIQEYLELSVEELVRRYVKVISRPAQGAISHDTEITQPYP